MANKPRHKEPTNFNHCCSCCNVLDKDNKRLKELIRWYAKYGYPGKINNSFV